MDKLEMIIQKEELEQKKKYYEKKARYVGKRLGRIKEKCDHGIVIFYGSTVTSNIAECLFCGADNSCYDVIKNAKNIIDTGKYVEGDPLLCTEINYFRIKMAYTKAKKENPNISDEEAVKRIDELLLGKM